MNNIFTQSELFMKTRYILAGVLVLIFFLLSNHFFYYKTLSWEKCRDGKCQVPEEKLQGIFGERESVFFSSPLVLEEGNFYRLIFEAKSDGAEPVDVFLSRHLSENESIGMVQIEKKADFNYYEISFQSQGTYDELIFCRGEADGRAEIYFRNIDVFPLTLRNSSELPDLWNTVINKPDFSSVNQEQMTDLKFAFSQLKGERAVLGQLFQSHDNFISGVRFFADVSDNGSESTRQFTLELREAIGEKNKFTLKKELLADLGFSLEALKKYRQADGSFLFPIFARLEKGKYYFISINNGKINDNRKDYLIPHGSQEDTYAGGFVALRRGSDLIPLTGDLGFVVYGMELLNDRLPPGSIVQDLGNGKKTLNFRTSRDASALLALSNKTPDIGFDDGRQALFGKSSDQSEFQYKLLAPNLVAKVIITAEQADEDWSKIRLSYSSDGIDWQVVEPSLEKGIQIFKREFQGGKDQRKVFVKIAYDGKDDSKRFYGVKNFSISAELNSI